MIVITPDIQNSYYDNRLYKTPVKDNPAAYSRLKNFMNLFEFIPNTSILSDTLLPPGILYADNSVVVYEKPPCVKNYFHIHAQVDSINEDNIDEQSIYSLPIPWQVYVVKYGSHSDEMYIEDVYMYFSNSSIQSFDQPVYLPPITNFYANGKLCRPYFDSMSDVIVPNNNLPGLVELSYNWVWNSGYNADLTESVMQSFVWGYARSKKLFPDISSSIRYNPLTNYYCSNEASHNFFRAWEKISIDNILFTNWFPPHTAERYHVYYNNVFNNNRVDWSLHNMSTLSISDACCEDCQYYDEDGDPVEDTCSYEDCSCHSEVVFNIDNTYQLLRDCGAFDFTSSLRKMISTINTGSVSLDFNFRDPLLIAG